MFRKWEVLLKIEKRQCSSCLQKKKKTKQTRIPLHFFTACFKQNIWKVIMTLMKFDLCSYISKAFDKVWHKCLIFKLKQNGISGKLLRTLTDFLNFRKQRVALKGPLSSWSWINCLEWVNPWPIVIFGLYKPFFGRPHNECHALGRRFFTFFSVI